MNVNGDERGKKKSVRKTIMHEGLQTLKVCLWQMCQTLHDVYT